MRIMQGAKDKYNRIKEGLAGYLGREAGYVSCVCVIVLLIGLLLAVLFYVLAGDQVFYKDSQLSTRTSSQGVIVAELDEDTVVEQQFTTAMTRLQSVSVSWSTGNRDNSGTVSMELIDIGSETCLGKKDFDAAHLAEGDFATLSFDKPLEGLKGVTLTLRLTADSREGCAVAPQMTAQTSEVGPLYLNGAILEGSLCMNVTGQNITWLGQHYWELVAGFIFILASYLWLNASRWIAGGKSRLFHAVGTMNRYHFLVKQLVNRDFKAKYKRSVLGVLWSFLNPLLTMGVQYVVFSNLFRFDVPHYPVYLLSGIVLFNYFSEACSLTLTSITNNAPLITKVYVPKYIYPLTRVLSSTVNMLIAMIPLLLVAILSGLYPTKSFFLTIYPVFCCMVFCFGLGLLLATLMVYFQDTQFLWGIFSMIWMYLTPIFYPASILPEQAAWIMKVNPLAYYIGFIRTCIIDGVSPDLSTYGTCAAFSVAMLVLGIVVFRKKQDEFVLYL